jgi:hypothetical protein
LSVAGAKPLALKRDFEAGMSRSPSKNQNENGDENEDDFRNDCEPDTIRLLGYF